MSEPTPSPPTLPASEPSAPQRRADALAATCHEALDADRAAEASLTRPLLTVFVDARWRSDGPGPIDATIESGPSVGIDTIERVVCGGAVEAMGVAGDGTPPATPIRTVPPKLSRFILHRDGGCAVDGCASRYRLQAPMSVPNRPATAPNPTIRRRSVGTTSTSWCTGEASASIPAHRPSTASSSVHRPTGATDHDGLTHPTPD